MDREFNKSNRALRRGEHLCACDMCGETAHSSEMRMMWNGLYVHADTCWEPRQPQDLIKGQTDVQVTGVTRTVQSCANAEYRPFAPPNWKNP